MYRMSKNFGFALIEILIVFAVTSLVASVIYPQITESKQKGEDARRAASMRTLQTIITEETNVGALPYTNMFSEGGVGSALGKFLSKTGVDSSMIDTRADSETYVLVFPLTTGEYQCIDWKGQNKIVPGRIVATTGPYSCELALGGTTENQIVSGARDFTFPDINTDGSITGAVIQHDDKIVIVGDFTDVNNTAETVGSFPGIARLNTDGTIDTTFLGNIVGSELTITNPEKVFVNKTTQNLIFLKDDDLLVFDDTGSFLFELKDISSVDVDFLSHGEMVVITRGDTPSVKLFSGNKLVNTFSNFSFSSGREGGGREGDSMTLKDVAVSNSDIIVYGNFTSYDENETGGIVRISSEDGTFLAGISPSFDTNGVQKIVPDSPVLGTLYVIGNFSTYNNQATRSIVHLNADLSVDTNWSFTEGESTYYHGFTTEQTPFDIVTTLDETQAIIVGKINEYDLTPISSITRIVNSTGLFDFDFSGLLINPDTNEPTEDTTIGFSQGIPRIILLDSVGTIIVIGDTPLSYHGSSLSQIVRIYP